MDRPIKKKHPIIRYKYHIAGCAVFIAFLVYVISAASGPRRLRYDADRLTIATVRWEAFQESLDQEGVVQPILTVRLNTIESGIVARIVAEAGDMLVEGDTILVMQNPDLQRLVEDERDELEKKRISHGEREIQMQRRTSELRRQTLRMEYDLQRIRNNYELVREEFNLGASSRAQLELAEEEYRFNRANTEMLREELRHDSLMHIIQTTLFENDFNRELLRFERIRERLDDLIVRSPISGQLSNINVIPGERLSTGSNIGELKVIDQFKITMRISEFYIDRIMPGLTASVTWQNQEFPLRITRVNPEVRDRQFAIELIFVDEQPENMRIGMNYRIKIELGQLEDAIVCPRGSFFQATGGQWIFRINEAGDRATRVPITIGRQNLQQYEILDGLQPGDRVIVSGYDNFGDAEEILLR